MSLQIKPPSTTLHARLHRAALVVLAIGMVAATSIWFLAPSASGDAVSASGLSAVGAGAMTQREEFEIEKVGGKAAVYVAKFDRWLTRLFHGKNLAGLIAVISLLVAFVCWRESRWQRDQHEFELSEKSAA